MTASWILFHHPEFTIDDAQAALALSLTVERAGDQLSVHWGEGTPTLTVTLQRGPDILAEAADIGKGTPHATALARCDARLEIGFDDLDEVLQEINTLIQTQLTLQDATHGFMFNLWNAALEPPSQTPRDLN